MLHQGSDGQGRRTTVTLASYCAPQKKIQWCQTDVSNWRSGRISQTEQPSKRVPSMLKGPKENSSKSEDSVLCSGRSKPIDCVRQQKPKRIENEIRIISPRRIPDSTTILCPGRSKEVKGVKQTTGTKSPIQVPSPKQSDNIIQILTPRPKSSESCQTEKSVYARSEERRIPCTGRTKPVSRKSSELRVIYPSHTNVLADRKEQCPSFSGLCRRSRVGGARVVCPSRTKLRQDRGTRVPCVGRGGRGVGLSCPGKFNRPVQNPCPRPLADIFKHDNRLTGGYSHKDTDAEKGVRKEAGSPPSAEEERRSRSIETIPVTRLADDTPAQTSQDNYFTEDVPVKEISVSSAEQDKPFTLSDKTKITAGVLKEDRKTGPSEKLRVPGGSADERRSSDKSRLSKEERRPSFIAEVTETRRMSAGCTEGKKNKTISGARKLSAGSKEGNKSNNVSEDEVKRISVTETSGASEEEGPSVQSETSRVPEETNEERKSSITAEVSEVKQIPIISEEETKPVTDMTEKRSSIESMDERRPSIISNTSETRRTSVTSKDEKKRQCVRETPETTDISVKYIERRVPCVPDASKVSEVSQEESIPSCTPQTPQITEISTEERLPSIVSEISTIPQKTPTEEMKSGDVSESLKSSELVTEEMKLTGTTETFESRQIPTAPTDWIQRSVSDIGNVKKISIISISSIEEQISPYTEETATKRMPYEENRVPQSETNTYPLSESSKFSGVFNRVRQPSTVSENNERKLSSNGERRSSELSRETSGERTPKRVSISDDTQTILEVNKLPVDYNQKDDYQTYSSDESRFANVKDSLTLRHSLDLGKHGQDDEPVEGIKYRSYTDRSTEPVFNLIDERKYKETMTHHTQDQQTDAEDTITRVSTDNEGYSMPESERSDEGTFDDSKKTSVCSTATSTKGYQRQVQCERSRSKQSQTKEATLSAYNLRQDEKKKTIPIAQKDDTERKSSTMVGKATYATDKLHSTVQTGTLTGPKLRSRAFQRKNKVVPLYAPPMTSQRFPEPPSVPSEDVNHALQVHRGQMPEIVQEIEMCPYCRTTRELSPTPSVFQYYNVFKDRRGRLFCNQCATPNSIQIYNKNDGGQKRLLCTRCGKPLRLITTRNIYLPTTCPRCGNIQMQMEQR